MKDITSLLRLNSVRLVVIVVLVAVAGVGIYRSTRGDDAQTMTASSGTTVAAQAPATGAQAPTADGAQRISIDLSSGIYDPDVIRLKAGVPAEVTFGRSSGCTRFVQSQDLGFQADLKRGPQTVTLPGLEPGTYGFACGMNMVSGQIVVE